MEQEALKDDGTKKGGKKRWLSSGVAHQVLLHVTYFQAAHSHTVGCGVIE
jgi:hypothetical protein